MSDTQPADSKSAATACSASTSLMTWKGDPVYMTPSRVHDDRNTYRIFHRDIPGRIIAEFYGETAHEMANWFCYLFGERGR